MTREEAIERVKRVKSLYAYESDYEALDMAIEALEYIEKHKDVLNLVNAFAELGFDTNKIIWSAQEWIPVSERLPDTNDKVLVTMIENEYGDTKVYFGSYVKSIQLWMVEDRTSYFTHVEVTAWMPLPEPYKAESEDKE